MTDNAIFILISIVLLLLFVPVDLRRTEMRWVSIYFDVVVSCTHCFRSEHKT